MQKCNNGKFCRNTEIKTVTDVHNCVEAKLEKHPDWKGNCFDLSDGAGCYECGGKMIKASSCSHCISCGWSSCG